MIGVACDDGRVYLADAQLNVLGALEVGGRPLLVEALGERLLAATADTMLVVGR
jgi:hypothetical protein